MSSGAPSFVPKISSPVCTTCTNIRELRQAEENLRKSEERFKSLTENSPDIIFTMEQDDIVSYINPAVELLLDCNRESCIGKSFFDLVDSENIPVCQNAFSKVLRQRQTIRDVDIRMRQTDRILRQFNLSAAPNVGSKGDIQGIIGSCRDVTEYRKLENQFHNAMKMEAIGTLADGIAHDLNNLLTGIIGNASLLLLDMDRANPCHTEIEAIQTYAQSGADLTRQLLGFARGGYETKPTGGKWNRSCSTFLSMLGMPCPMAEICTLSPKTRTLV